MKRIINSKKYDTETAELIGENGNGLGYSDFRYYYETLYRKKTGEFFLHGEGGPLSQYAKHCGNTSTGSSTIIPLTDGDALEWAEKNLNVDKYEELFGEVAE